jgi:hypothetical protein
MFRHAGWRVIRGFRFRKFSCPLLFKKKWEKEIRVLVALSLWKRNRHWRKAKENFRNCKPITRSHDFHSFTPPGVRAIHFVRCVGSASLKIWSR